MTRNQHPSNGFVFQRVSFVLTLVFTLLLLFLGSTQPGKRVSTQSPPAAAQFSGTQFATAKGTTAAPDSSPAATTSHEGDVPAFSSLVGAAQVSSPQHTELASTAEAAGMDLTTIAPTLSLEENFWMELPILPETISDVVRETYQKGRELGNNPHIFTRVGDCASRSPDFLDGFDESYNLGDYAYLQPTIDYFKGTFSRPSQAAKASLNSSSMFTSIWNGDQCRVDELLLECQYRIDHPSFAFISLGSNEPYFQLQDPQRFERNMRAIIELTLEKGIFPILVTKADNLEGDNSINATIARLSLEYEIPLWNFWRATRPLVDHGLGKDAVHLNSWSSTGFTDFTNPHSLEYGKEVRNLNALQVLDFLLRELEVPLDRK
jgi:hypothetical protein